MRVDIRHNPSFPMARVMLAPGEPLQVEAGAMAAMAPDTSVQAQMQGGLMKSLARGVLGGESLFITTYTGPGEVLGQSRNPAGLISYLAARGLGARS